jgi:tetratricopeptide (TPR) repeat protein
MRGYPVRLAGQASMQQQDLETRWERAQTLDAQGDLPRARAEYEAILGIAPRQPLVRLRLSDIAEREGRYRDARREAIAAADIVRTMQRQDLLPFATLRLLAFDERDLVRELILGADWTQPAVLAQSAVLSQHLWLIDEFDAALRLIDAAMQRARPHHLLHYSRANALRYQGRIAEATEEFERTIALAPDYPYAHWSLAYHAKAMPPGSRVERVRRARAANAADPLALAHLHYALFKELDDAGDTQAAWRELEAGARLMRAELRHDDAAEAAGIAALQALPSVAPPATDARVERTPIFIVGMPRTGTTVLERILGNHRSVASAGELNAFAHALAEAADGFVATPPSAQMVERLAGVDFDLVGREYLARTSGRYGSHTHLVDKNPLNVFHAGFIARALPQARILCLVRDPVDACFSNLKELFAGDAYAYSYDLRELANHALRFNALVEHWQRALPGRFMTVRYEDMVADPARTAEAVMAFCGLPFEADAADITRNLSPSSTASSSQVREPIHARSVGAWRRHADALAPMIERLERPDRG